MNFKFIGFVAKVVLITVLFTARQHTSIQSQSMRYVFELIQLKALHKLSEYKIMGVHCLIGVISNSIIEINSMI